MKEATARGLALLAVLTIGGVGKGAADEVSRWNEVATAAAAESGLPANPLFEARVYAMSQVAVHDALNAIRRRYEPYALDARAGRRASPDAAVAAAAYGVLTDQFSRLEAFGFPSPQATLDAAYADSLAEIPADRSRDEGVAIGERAAAAILARRAGDGWDQQELVDVDYPQGAEPGEYRFTPPFDFAFLPTWSSVTPFVLRHAAQFRPGPPDEVTRRSYTEDFLEVKRLGGDGVTTPSARTPDETEIALFWVDSSPQQWNQIARTVSARCRHDRWQNARLFALLNLALADGYIGTFETKYHYNYWRPITAIREADTDGNPRTLADPTWTPLVVTPPIPDYDSGHAVQGGAAAQVLRRFFGTDLVRFQTCSTSLPPESRCGGPSPVIRSYRSFSEAASENGLSRILVGFHFRKAVLEGIEHGRRIGDRAVDRFLRPAH